MNSVTLSFLVFVLLDNSRFISGWLHMMDDEIVNLRTKLLEKEGELADLKRKLDQMEKVL